MRTFYEWLIKQEYRDDPIGDLSCDVLRDKTLPDKVTKNSLISHMNFKNVPGRTTDVVHEAWKEYKEYRLSKKI